MKIADIELGDRPLLLAPMEDVTDPSFRYMCKRFGADVVYTEFISSDGLSRWSSCWYATSHKWVSHYCCTVVVLSSKNDFFSHWVV